MNDINPDFGFDAVPIKITNETGNQRFNQGNDFKHDSQYSEIK